MKEATLVQEPEPVKELKHADLEQAMELFKKYGNELVSMRRKSLAQYFFDPLLEMHEGQLNWTVGSNSLKTEIEEENLKLRQFFERNEYILPTITCIINAEKTSKPMTQKERFEEASKEFPILSEFAERFGLDFNH